MPTRGLIGASYKMARTIDELIGAKRIKQALWELVFIIVVLAALLGFALRCT